MCPPTSGGQWSLSRAIHWQRKVLRWWRRLPSNSLSPFTCRFDRHSLLMMAHEHFCYRFHSSEMYHLTINLYILILCLSTWGQNQQCLKCVCIHARLLGIAACAYSFYKTDKTSGVSQKNRVQLAMLSGWERWYTLSSVNHRDTGQSRASLSPCMWMKVDSTSSSTREEVEKNKVVWFHISQRKQMLVFKLPSG